MQPPMRLHDPAVANFLAEIEEVIEGCAPGEAKAKSGIWEIQPEDIDLDALQQELGSKNQATHVYYGMTLHPVGERSEGILVQAYEELVTVGANGSVESKKATSTLSFREGGMLAYLSVTEENRQQPSREGTSTSHSKDTEDICIVGNQELAAAAQAVYKICRRIMTNATP